VDTDPTERKHLDWVQRYNTILGDWSGSWASLPPRRFSTPKLFIGILQQATLEWVYGTRTCYEGASKYLLRLMSIALVVFWRFSVGERKRILIYSMKYRTFWNGYGDHRKDEMLLRL